MLALVHLSMLDVLQNRLTALSLFMSCRCNPFLISGVNVKLMHDEENEHNWPMVAYGSNTSVIDGRRTGLLCNDGCGSRWAREGSICDQQTALLERREDGQEFIRSLPAR